MWAAGFGGSQTTAAMRRSARNDTTSRVFGTAVGADYRFSPNTIAGFALAGGGTNFTVNGFGNGRSDLFQAGAFVRHTVGPAYFIGRAGLWLAGHHHQPHRDHRRHRSVAGALQRQRVLGPRRGRLSFCDAVDGHRLTPYAAAQFTTFDLPAYAEQAIVGANTFALAYGAKSVTDTRSEVGLRTDKSFAMTDCDPDPARPLRLGA